MSTQAKQLLIDLVEQLLTLTKKYKEAVETDAPEEVKEKLRAKLDSIQSAIQRIREAEN